jgi:hypothetical protein
VINGKTYYQILGILEDAEDIVIRAAYKALAQRYHPDKWQGSAEEANRKMSEINQAHETLSDSVKRNEYDRTINRGEYQSEIRDEADTDDSMGADWKEVINYYPDLKEITASLRAISISLERTYKFILLEKKLFQERVSLAEQLERTYLEKYFGTNEMVLSFARFCIKQNNKNAAREVNKAINLLGSKIDPSLVIDKVISLNFPGGNVSKTRAAWKFLVTCEYERPDVNECELFVRSMGAVITNTGFFSKRLNIYLDNRSSYDIDANGLYQYAVNLASRLTRNKH